MPSPVHYLLQQNAGNGGLVGLMNSAEFILPLSDAGNGAVNLSLARGAGAATFTRATAAATKLSTGLWKLDVASGTARSSYIGLNTAVGAYGGYLAEGAATQLCLDPRDMTTANWVLGATMTRAKTSTGIDGTANSATRLTGGAVTGTNTILQTLLAAATSRTYSAWVRRVTGTGTITLLQGTASLDITALINSTTYTLVQLNDNELNVAYGLQIATNGDAIDVDCNQFEAGSIATTPIPAAGTRNGDMLTFPVSNVNRITGTSYAEISTIFPVTIPAGVFLGLAIAGSGQLLEIDAVTAISSNDGSTFLTKSGLTSAATGVRKRISSWGASGRSLTGDGAAVQSGAFDGAMGDGSSSLFVGVDANSGSSAFSMMMNIRIWQRQLPDPTLQAITA